MKNKVILFAVIMGFAFDFETQSWAEAPHIVGIAHMAYYVSDLGTAREYCEEFLYLQDASR